MKNRAERLGFNRYTYLPPVGEGEVMVKFHGRPAIIPARAEGEQIVGNSGFTERQLRTLEGLNRFRSQYGDPISQKTEVHADRRSPFGKLRSFIIYKPDI